MSSFISQTIFFKSKGNEKFKLLKLNLCAECKITVQHSEHTIKASHFVAGIMLWNMKQVSNAQLALVMGSTLFSD
jgi:hypothetical protein